MWKVIRDESSLTVAGVSNQQAELARLLQEAGFSGRSQGGVRMRRSGVLPPSVEVPAGVEIRAFVPGEEATWIALKNECFGEDGGRQWELGDFAREFTAMPQYEAARILVAQEGDRLLGTSTAWEIEYDGRAVGLVDWVGGVPAARGRGLGRALVVRTLEELARRGYPDAWLNTSRDRRAAVGLYESLDFVVVRELFDYVLPLS